MRPAAFLLALMFVDAAAVQQTSRMRDERPRLPAIESACPSADRQTAGIRPPRARLPALSLGNAAADRQTEGPPPTAPKATTQPDQDSPTDLRLTVGKSLVIDSALPFERISVGFGDIAEATMISPRQLLLNAKTSGVTSLIVWLEGGRRQTFDITVVASSFLADSRVEGIRREMERELPGQSVDLSFENETVFLRGTVRDATSADRAVSIASTLGKTVNLLYVDVPPPTEQILLKVKFASVDRSVTTQLGLNIVSSGATNTIGSATTQQYSPPGFGIQSNAPPALATLSDALNLFFFRPDLNLGATIAALETKGLLQVLAEPNMLAENGKQASFLAGGEFPFPSVSSNTGGAPVVTIQFREFGVRLAFIPTITPRGTIHLEVAPEVSALDFTNGLSVSGFNVPALTTRKLSTQVELSEGQSFAIGGLLDNRTTDTFEKIPFIGDIPVLGKLFRSKSVSKQNTELIVIVTPELVRPTPAGQPTFELNYPTPFLSPNTGQYPRTPALNVTGFAPVEPPNATIPIETLIQSSQPAAAPVQQNPPPAAASAKPLSVPSR
jgi:pilus assembly protein CpaC